MLFTSKQDQFDHIVKHLLTQNKKSEVETSVGYTCSYRGPDNTACAIGACIPDDMWTKDTNNWSVRRLLEEYPGLAALWPMDIYELTELQHIHDGLSEKNWRAHLMRFADRNKLEFNY